MKEVEVLAYDRLASTDHAVQNMGIHVVMCTMGTVRARLLALAWGIATVLGTLVSSFSTQHSPWCTNKKLQ